MATRKPLAMHLTWCRPVRAGAYRLQKERRRPMSSRGRSRLVTASFDILHIETPKMRDWRGFECNRLASTVCVSAERTAELLLSAPEWLRLPLGHQSSDTSR